MSGAHWLIAAALSYPALAISEEPAGAVRESSQAEMQVWLETQANAAGQTVMLPYVKSSQTLQLRASVTVIKKGRAGNSRISQQGTLDTLAGEAMLLARLALSLTSLDECHMDIVLNDQVTSTEVGRYRLGCHP